MLRFTYIFVIAVAIIISINGLMPCQYSFSCWICIIPHVRQVYFTQQLSFHFRKPYVPFKATSILDWNR